LSDNLAEASIAILGFGNQGEAQALALRDSGLSVTIGARPEGRGHARAREHGFETVPLAEAARRADIVSVLLPDEIVPALWPELEFAPTACVVFAHGFNLLYADLSFPPRADVILVAPTGPGFALRQLKQRGANMPAYLAVHRDASGAAWERAEFYARRLGCAPTWRTTIREETEVDLFGEQAVLCGGMNALVRSAFDVLVERGYSPEMAYLECVHQLKHLADLLHAKGVTGLRESISATALYGDLTRGPRVIGEASRAGMREVLDEIRRGEFAREWLAEVAAGSVHLREAVENASIHPSEEARRRVLAAREARKEPR